jgi:hypothetical protein
VDASLLLASHEYVSPRIAVQSLNPFMRCIAGIRNENGVITAGAPIFAIEEKT